MIEVELHVRKVKKRGLELKIGEKKMVLSNVDDYTSRTERI